MKTNSRIAAVVLASGMSKRMGTAKQLLLLQGVTLLEYIIRKLLPLPFEKICVIIGNQSEEIMNRIHIEDPRCEWKINRMYKEGQSAALKVAVESVNELDGMMVFLADQPLISDETIKIVFDRATHFLVSHQGDFVVQPSFFNKSGHPVFFSNRLFSLFHKLEGDEGGRRIINLATSHYLVPVEDPGILLDIDTPEDYQRLLRIFDVRKG
ncbi:nucleotidyltransferase family protein [Effusibacillus dendaii]|nr:nucleotidyltransferase family protein [Effusibacillus dendaii]